MIKRIHFNSKALVIPFNVQKVTVIGSSYIFQEYKNVLCHCESIDFILLVSVW